jgi:hypothetical protein
MKSYVIGAMAGMVIAGTLVLPAPAQVYQVWGLGNKRCGAWTETASTDKMKAEAYQSWVHGFITGAAYGREGLDFKKGAKLEPEAFTQAVGQYCSKNPLMTIERAAVDLLNQIANEKGKP